MGFTMASIALLGLFVLVLCSSGSKADSNFQEQLLARIEALEKQGHAQAAKIQKLEVRLEDQTERLDGQEKTITEYKERVRELEQTVAELTRDSKNNPGVSGDPKYPQDDTGLGSDKHKTQLMKVVTGKGEQYVTRQRRLLMEDASPVAFNALITHAEEMAHLGLNQTIIFPLEKTNIGGGYHSRTGVFIAPRAGIYLFSTSITSYNTNHDEVYVDIVHNGHVLGAAYAHSDSGRHDQGSRTVVTQMVAGDEVMVRVAGPADTSLWGGNMSGFMGCLIFPL